MNSIKSLFWHRVENLEKAIKLAKDVEFKTLWKDKLRQLMKKIPTRLIN